jgi:hypothetical protein
LNERLTQPEPAADYGHVSLHSFDPEFISLKGHPQLNEVWLQDRIADNPKILGLGDLLVRDRERRQPYAGRLDLLLQHPESFRRYEVEIQLGRTDESHIIRTIEYWDIERRRYPQYEHCAVLVAEDITSRFLNVIGLFNGFIPLIAIKLQAIRVDNGVGLVFTTVLNELPLGREEEEEEAREVVDRAYWLQRGTPSTVELADRLAGAIREFAPGHELKYNKYYIGLAHNGQANNFVTFRPRKSVLRLEVKLPEDELLTQRLEEAGLAGIDYDSRWGAYRFDLSPGDIDAREPLLLDLARQAYEARA